MPEPPVIRRDHVVRSWRNSLVLAAAIWCVAGAFDTCVLIRFIRAPADRQEPGSKEARYGQVSFGVHLDAPGELRLKLSNLEIPISPTEWRPAPKAPRPPEGPEELPPLIHTVAPGETLIGIARGYLGPGADWRAIAKENSLEEPYVLKVGRELRITAVRVAKTSARAELVRDCETPAEQRLRAALAAEKPSPPQGAFEPPQERLILVHPILEAFPWRKAALWGALVAAGLVIAAVSALPSAGPLAHIAGALMLGAASAVGAFALWAGASTFMASHIARSRTLEIAWVIASGAICGGVAAFAAWLVPIPKPELRERICKRFGMAAAIAVTSALGLASIAGWMRSAMDSLALPD